MFWDVVETNSLNPTLSFETQTFEIKAFEKLKRLMVKNLGRAKEQEQKLKAEVT